MSPLTIDAINRAAQQIAPYIHRTPLLTSASFDHQLDTQLLFKCENFQKGGAFKARGACNAVLNLSQRQCKNGVVTHSSGNHAQGLAYAAKVRGIAAYVVMPTTTPQIKIDATKKYGATVRLCEPTLAARQQASDAWAAETGATFIHPNDNYEIMAGQGTVATELIADAKNFDMLICPVGGGGLLGGISTVIKALSPHTEVIGVEPVGANDAEISLRTGVRTAIPNPHSVAEGLLSTVGAYCFPILQENVDRIVTVSDDDIVNAMQALYERMKIVVEPSGATAFAALHSGKLQATKKRVAIILSGGNTPFRRGAL